MKQVKITTTATDINTDAQQTQRMTSLEIAELTGKQHKNVMQAIRNMEPAWEKTCGLKFQLTSRTIIQPNGGTRKVPCYQLTKTECLYIATKFNDETGFIVSSLCGSEVFGSELRLLFSLFT